MFFSFGFEMATADQYQDLPLTALCILADKLNCPARYIAIERAYDTKTEIDLWKDGLFGRRTNRYICYTKEFPIATTYNVVEDLKLFNDGDNIPQGYIALDKTDDTGEKTFQRKTLHAKISLRFYTDIAVSDIVILARSKRAPTGYNLVGVINNHTICVRYSKIPKQQKTCAPDISERIRVGGANNENGCSEAAQAMPGSDAIKMPTPYGRQSSDFYKTVQRIYDSAANYNPLQGVPFEINPIYSKNSSSSYFDTDTIDKYAKVSDILSKYEYDFNLEKLCIQDCD